MNVNIAMSIDRADELLDDLKREYDKSLEDQAVSARAVHFTHEVCERLRSVLDRLARLYWEKHVAPALAADDCARATIYFPVTNDQNSFRSVMGRWRWGAVQRQHLALEQYLLDLQPFSKPDNDWLRILSELAVASKHLDLVPQKRKEDKRVIVSGGNGSVSWGPGVTFGGGVSIMGAAIDPQTQRIIPSAGLNEKIEIWVSFLIDGYNINALGFCSDACQKVRGIAESMTRDFNL